LATAAFPPVEEGEGDVVVVDDVVVLLLLLPHAASATTHMAAIGTARKLFEFLMSLLLR
jgi:hypothetical protein